MTPLRDQLTTLAKAPWLQKVWLYRVLYAFAIQFDALVDWAVMGIKCRFPQYALPSALGTLGRERGIRRGLFETDAQYAARLINWVPDRKRKGSPYALMNQIAGYFTGYPVRIRIVNNRGTWYTREADGTETWHRELPYNWIWDATGGAYDSRYYVIIYVNLLPLYAALWGNSLNRWGDGLLWGGNFLAGVGATLKAIVQDWNPPNAQCDWIVVAKDYTSFAPDAPYPSAGFPDSNWDVWANRLSTALYMRGH